MIWIVYRTTCKINGKFYIGVHKTETDEIFDGYYGNGIQIPKHTYSITHPKYPFHFAFKKYGQDQFYRETLAKFDNPIDAYKYEAKLVTPEVINKGNTYNVTAGGGRTHPTKGKVYQYSLEGKLLKIWDCINTASKILQISRQSIGESINKKVARHGFLWSWDKNINITEYKIKQLRTYYIYDHNGNFIRELTFKKCIEILNTNGSNLSRAIKNKYTINKYFITLEKVDYFIPPKNRKLA